MSDGDRRRGAQPRLLGRAHLRRSARSAAGGRRAGPAQIGAAQAGRGPGVRGRRGRPQRPELDRPHRLLLRGGATAPDNFTAGEFGYRLAAFDRDYADLLADLATLPSHPQRSSSSRPTTSLRPDAQCATARGPLQYPGLTPEEIQLLADRNAALNQVLTAGARRYGFDVVAPPLSPLCVPDARRPGPRPAVDHEDRYPFHPTAVGELRLTIPVVDRVGVPSAPPPG